MSKYYEINGLKVRVSDHEPNEKLRGSSDIELYVRSADNRLLSIEAQLEAICERNDYNINDFAEVLKDWADGTYDLNVFVAKKDEDSEEGSSSDTLAELQVSRSNEIESKLQGHHLSRFAGHNEVKALSELTGVSQSTIKKYFNIR